MNVQRRPHGNSAWLLAAICVAASLASAPSVSAVPASDTAGLATFTVDRSGATPVNTYTWTVPKGVKTVKFDVFGASGEGGSLGEGGQATATYSVVPGQAFEIVVGGTPTSPSVGGLNGGGDSEFGGGGGGSSDVRSCATASEATCDLLDRFIVAGGGGGRSGDLSAQGGEGGGLTGQSGHLGGGGGSQLAGGIGGSGGGVDGTFGLGGQASNSGGAGGGGWYGGGGTGTPSAAGGGGSGHICGPALSRSMNTGVWEGDGKVVIYKG